MDFVGGMPDKAKAVCLHLNTLGLQGGLVSRPRNEAVT